MRKKLHRQGRQSAKEKKSFTAKEIIVGTKAGPEGREGTAPKVAYGNASGSTAAEIKNSCSLAVESFL
jgi:hypothetical protein